MENLARKNNGLSFIPYVYACYLRFTQGLECIHPDTIHKLIHQVACHHGCGQVQLEKHVIVTGRQGGSDPERMLHALVFFDTRSQFFQKVLHFYV